MAARRFVVTGRVQGVGFRYFVSRWAEALGVRGEVWNRRDGAVELVACHHDPSRLDTLQAALWTGPGFVQDVNASDWEEPFGMDGFTIGPTR